MKKIGLLCNIRTDSDRFSFNVAYYNFAKTLGTVVLIEPRSLEIIEDLDLLILPGGEDVYPLRYGEAPEINTGLPNMGYEFFDAIVLPEYIKRKVPIFGICRGLQTLNVMFGGSLIQHIYEPTSNSSIRWEHVHDVIDTRTNQRFSVNSLHHQAINVVAEDFEVLLRGKSVNHKDVKKERDLQIEAIKHKSLPILAVQFHPEEMFDDANSEEVTGWIYQEIYNLYETEHKEEAEKAVNQEAQ